MTPNKDALRCDLQSPMNACMFRDQCRRLVAENEAQAALLRQAVGVINRYRNETPLGHQPHMIADKADAMLAAITQHLENKQ